MSEMYIERKCSFFLNFLKAPKLNFKFCSISPLVDLWNDPNVSEINCSIAKKKKKKKVKESEPCQKWSRALRSQQSGGNTAAAG